MRSVWATSVRRVKVVQSARVGWPDFMSWSICSCVRLGSAGSMAGGWCVSYQLSGIPKTCCCSVSVTRKADKAKPIVVPKTSAPMAR